MHKHVQSGNALRLAEGVYTLKNLDPSKRAFERTGKAFSPFITPGFRFRVSDLDTSPVRSIYHHHGWNGFDKLVLQGLSGVGALAFPEFKPDDVLIRTENSVYHLRRVVNEKGEAI